MTKKNLMLMVALGAVAAWSPMAALAQANTTSQTTAASTSTAADDELEFKKGELDLSPYGLYSDQAGGKWGAGAALTYYVTDNIGVGGSTYWTDLGGTVFDNAAAEGYFRLPLFKRIAPYAVASLGYQFDREYWFESFGAGVDFRAFKRLHAFGDLQYRIANTSHSGDGAFIRFGARFSF